MNLANKYECECDVNHYGVHCNSTHNDCDADLEELCGVGVQTCNNLERQHENDREAYECTCKDGYDVIHNKCVQRRCNAFFLSGNIVPTPSRINDLSECLNITGEGGLVVPSSTSPQFTSSATFVVDIEFQDLDDEILYYSDIWEEGGIHYQIYSGQFGMDIYGLGSATFDWKPETDVFYRIGVEYDGRSITLFVNNIETETKSFPHQQDNVTINVGSNATIGGKKSGRTFGAHGGIVLGAFAITEGAYVVAFERENINFHQSFT